jgi:hypothetical protein
VNGFANGLPHSLGKSLGEGIDGVGHRLTAKDVHLDMKQPETAGQVCGLLRGHLLASGTPLRSSFEFSYEREEPDQDVFAFVSKTENGRVLILLF